MPVLYLFFFLFSCACLISEARHCGNLPTVSHVIPLKSLFYGRDNRQTIETKHNQITLPGEWLHLMGLYLILLCEGEKLNFFFFVFFGNWTCKFRFFLLNEIKRKMFFEIVKTRRFSAHVSPETLLMNDISVWFVWSTDVLTAQKWLIVVNCFIEKITALRSTFIHKFWVKSLKFWLKNLVIWTNWFICVCMYVCCHFAFNEPLFIGSEKAQVPKNLFKSILSIIQIKRDRFCKLWFLWETLTMCLCFFLLSFYL